MNVQGFDGEISFTNNTVRNNMVLIDSVYPYNYNSSTMAGIEISELLDANTYTYMLASGCYYMLGGFTSPYREVDDAKP